jgi:hypothetical protein
MRQQTAFSTWVRQILSLGLVWPVTNLTTFSLSRAGVREMAAARDYQRFSARCLEAARRTDDAIIGHFSSKWPKPGGDLPRKR